MNFLGQESAWLPCSASFSATVGMSGRRARLNTAPHSIFRSSRRTKRLYNLSSSQRFDRRPSGTHVRFPLASIIFRLFKTAQIAPIELATIILVGSLNWWATTIADAEY